MKSLCYQVGRQSSGTVTRMACFFQIKKSQASTVGLQLSDYAIGSSVDTMISGLASAYAAIKTLEQAEELVFSITWPSFSALYNVDKSTPGTISGVWPSSFAEETDKLTLYRMIGNGIHNYNSSQGFPVTIVQLDYTFLASKVDIQFDKYVEYDKLTRTILAIYDSQPATTNGLLHIIAYVKTSKAISVTCTDNFWSSMPHAYDVSLSDGNVTSTFRTWYQERESSTYYGSTTEPWLGPAGFSSEAVGTDLNGLPDFKLTANLDIYDITPFEKLEVYSRV